MKQIAQFNELKTESDGEILDISTAFSIYDCINECIKNSFCYTSTHIGKDKFNCYLKTKYENNKPLSNNSTTNQVFEIKGFLKKFFSK